MAELGLVFKIGGVDLKPFLKKKGLQFTRNDVDSPASGEMADGTIRRDRIIIRRSINVSIRDVPRLTTSEMSMIQQLIFPEYIKVEFTCPYEGQILTRTFYSNTIPATAAIEEDDILYWTGFTFNIVEQGVAGYK